MNNFLEITLKGLMSQLINKNEQEIMLSPRMKVWGKWT